MSHWRLLSLALGAVLVTASPSARSAPPTPTPYVKAPILPSQARYLEVMQNANHHLRDGGLRDRVQLVKGHDGSPLHWSGSYGTVFKGRTPTQTVAIRVFHATAKPETIRDIQHRYERIQAFFDKLSADKKMPAELLPVAFVAAGLHVDGHDVPILKSPWVEGDELHEFIGKQIASHKEASLGRLAQNWRGVMRDLRRVGVAHGDLQHRNVKVGPDLGMHLIDYDAMFVPSLKGQFNSEIGHTNFQHPEYHFDANGNPRARIRPFNDRMDHFSSFVVYASLVALAKHPELWKKYHDGNNLIFDGRRDFWHPDTSPVFKDLLASPHVEARTLARKLMEYAKGYVGSVPPLEEAIDAPESDVPFAQRVSLHGEEFSARGLSLGSQAVPRP